TAQYGHTPSVTVAPRSRDAFFEVCGLYGWGLDATGRLNIGVSSGVERLHDGKRGAGFRYNGEWRDGRSQADALGPRIDVEPVCPDEAEHSQAVFARQIHRETRWGSHGRNNRD